MMNRHFKFKIFLFSLLILSSSLSAIPRCILEPVLEVKTGYFFFADSKMRQVYDKGGLDIQLCASYPLWNLCPRWRIHAYAAVEYFHLSGKSMNDHQHTALWSIPINIGLMPVYSINDRSQYYFAFGPRYFYIHQHNDSPYVYENSSGNCPGFFVNTGVNYRLCNQIVIDVFGEYSYGKMHFHGGRPDIYTRDVQVGGITFGGGLGYEF